MTIKLLIVVPTLNSYNLLPKLIQSLQSQTFRDWRCLFIDGPSSKEHRQWLSNCCQADSRFQWSDQKPQFKKIFGAMNQGFQEAKPEEWVLFWGSDDWATDSTILQKLIEAIPHQSEDISTDLVIAKGRYANNKGQLTRRTTFTSKTASIYLTGKSYRRKIFFGETPPHQATLFGPSSRKKLNHYRERFKLSADLDYFLRLGEKKNLNVYCVNLELVHMSDEGISRRQANSRYYQVAMIYKDAFHFWWWIPFMSRYARRLASALKR